MSAVIELDRLEVFLGGRPVLKGLTTVLGGRSIGLLGPNGAGKTTLLNTLLGFYRPRGGTARLFGFDVRYRRGEALQKIGFMPENDSFIAGMSAVRFVRMMGELSGLPPRQALERAHEALFYVGLGEARYRKIETFSLGMKQLAKLAQAIVHGPELLLLDEPTNGLDPPHRVRMLELVREVRDRGTTVVLSSHLLRDVEECCEEVLVLKDGAIAAQCDLEAERRANRRFLELELGGDAAGFAEGLERLGCPTGIAGKQKLRIVLPEGMEVRDLYRLAAERDQQLRRIDFKKTSLEEIFLKAMGETNGGL